MTSVVLIHGAFRGAWSWEPVQALLGQAGIESVAVDLTGMGAGDLGRSAWLEQSPSVHIRNVSMDDWIGDAWRAAGLSIQPNAEGDAHDATDERVHSAEGSPDVVFVGHSMGGVVAAAAGSQLVTRMPAARVRVILLDAPIIEDGLRSVDVSSPAPVDDRALPPPTTWIPPRPVGTDDGFSDSLAEWVNQRICATPFNPSLDAVAVPAPMNPVLVFCELTPAFYPGSLARAACDAKGVGYRLLACHHDAPLLAPDLVAQVIAETVGVEVGVDAGLEDGVKP